MATISSNTLFHFTPTAEYLISVLANNFQPRYCFEKFTLDDKTFELGIPMVCFCDIPLSQIKNHVETYGVYGIGMTKKWAKEKGLNPILYVKEKSLLSVNLLQILATLQKKELEDIEHLDKIKTAYVKIFRYLKPYEGDFLRGSTLLNNVRFYNEREWRYTPEWTNENKLFLTKEQFNNPITKADENEKLKEQVLSFEPNDIAYIIVKEEKEIFPMISALKKIKGKYDARTIEILNSRIVTCEQILNDF